MRAAGRASDDGSALLSDTFPNEVCVRLKRGSRLRRTLPGKGRLHVDRPLPFLCVFRNPPDEARGGDAAAVRMLVRGEGSYLVAPGDAASQAGVARLIEAIVGVQADTFGAFLLLEAWPAPDGASDAFRIVTPRYEKEPSTLGVLRDALGALTLPGLAGEKAGVEVVPGAVCAPPGMPPLLTTEQAKQHGCLLLGLEVPSRLYRDEDGALLPLVYQRFRAEFGAALRRALFDFTQVQTNHRPAHYQALGRRAVVRAVWEADRELADIDAKCDLLLSVTPVNTEAAWQEFASSGWQRTPAFHYRLLPLDPDTLKRRLFALRLEEIEDAALARLFRDKRRELDRQITLLEDRDTPAFLGGSLALFGGVSGALLSEAERMLAALRPAGPRAPTPAGDGTFLDASAFAERARAEIAFYRGRWPALATEARLRNDVPGVMVAAGDLLIGNRVRIDARRVEALLHHEVGTHVLTFVNGAAQPLKLLARGLPGYEELQEGLAVLAEYLAGGLTASRLRLLAARVVAVRMLTDGADFVEVFRALREGHGFRPRGAFNIAMRVFRGGGFTKDAVYLRGLRFVLGYLRDRGCRGDRCVLGAAALPPGIEALWVGKVGAEHLPLVEELRWREVLRPIPLTPRWLTEDPRAASRFTDLLVRENPVSPLELVEGETERTLLPPEDGEEN